MNTEQIGTAAAKRRYAMVDLGDGPQRVLVRQLDGVDGFDCTFTESCTGCFEPGEYMGMAHQYRWDDKAKCYVGIGCSECGYTGKRRNRWWCPLAGFGLDPTDAERAS